MSQVTLPSRQGLLLRVGGSLAAAAVALFGFVLPAEYHIDPTGFGKLTGLTAMSKAAPASTTAAHSYNGQFRTDDVDLTLAPGESYEYKVRMKPDTALIYSWKASTPLEFDFHGEADKDPENATSYTAANGAESHGSLIAPFQGIHGWYWRNNSKDFADIHLKMGGFYELTVDFSE